MNTLTSQTDLLELLKKYDRIFPYSLTGAGIDIEAFSSKLADNATTLAINRNEEVIGFITFYANNMETKEAYIVLLAVEPAYQGKGLAYDLLDAAITDSKESGMVRMKLEVDKDKLRAISFYKKNQFDLLEDASEKSVYMVRELS